jgi:predicted TIM-barrel fold metal-dependent hydrolase
MGRIDCDIHPAVPSVQALLPYLSDHWREQVAIRGIDGMELNSYPPTMPLSCRADWRVADRKPGSDLSRMQADALDKFGISTAICNVIYGSQAILDPYMEVAFCSATNQWLAREWLQRDTRLRASIVVPMQNPSLAVEEIEKWASDPRFVQVLLLSTGEAPLGRRHFWPIYAAAEKHGLTVGIHAGSQYRQAPSSAGFPSYRYEFYQAEAQAFQSQVVSLVFEGVFKEYPRLKVVLMESGVSWLPAFMWRATKTWRGLRNEAPWIDRSPADIIRDHIRLTVQPFDGPPDATGLTNLLDQIGSEDMLLFASDYPHWQFDGEDPIPPGFPSELVRRMCVDNPLNTYPRLKETIR